MTTGVSLNTKQRRAVTAMMTAPTIKAAADLAQVSERTLHRWLDDDSDFQAALRQATDQATQATIARLAGEQMASVNALAEIRDNTDYPPSTRVAAARAILAEMRHQREFAELADRLTEIERILNEHQK